MHACTIDGARAMVNNVPNRSLGFCCGRLFQAKNTLSWLLRPSLAHNDDPLSPLFSRSSRSVLAVHHRSRVTVLGCFVVQGISFRNFTRQRTFSYSTAIQRSNPSLNAYLPSTPDDGRAVGGFTKLFLPSRGVRILSLAACSPLLAVGLGLYVSFSATLCISLSACLQ